MEIEERVREQDFTKEEKVRIIQWEIILDIATFEDGKNVTMSKNTTDSYKESEQIFSRSFSNVYSLIDSLKLAP